MGSCFSKETKTQDTKPESPPEEIAVQPPDSDLPLNTGPLICDNAEELLSTAKKLKQRRESILVRVIQAFKSAESLSAKSREILEEKDESISVNWQDYEFDKRNDTVIALTAVPKNMPLAIYNCNKLEFHCLAPVAQVTIEGVSDSYIHIGPCESSIFLRDCKNCNILVSSSQLR
jgi:hypothetical protein